jgi:HSP20 family protein
MTDKDLQVQEKQEVQSEAEGTRNVPIYVPPVDIYESEQALILVADMPGVSSQNVDIDLKNNELSVRGTVSQKEPQGEHMLLKEYGVGDYYRQFTIGKLIDQSKIEASMKDGVLTLTLPKAELAKPRKISVKSS